MDFDFVGMVAPFKNELKELPEKILNLLGMKYIYYYQIDAKDDVEIDKKYLFITTEELIDDALNVHEYIRYRFESSGILFDTLAEAKLASYRELQSFITDDIDEIISELLDSRRTVISFIESVYYRNTNSYNMLEKYDKEFD